MILRDRSPLATAVVTSAMLRTCAVRLPAIEFTLSVRSFHVPATPGTCACPPSLPSVPTSRATRVTSEAKALSWSTIVLMVFFSSRISPFTSTVILRDRSPRATAVATSAMLRTCAVRLLAIEFTLSVRSFHVPATPGTCACPPSLPSVPTSRATRVTSAANDRSWSTIVLMASLSCRISPRTSTVILRGQVPARDGGGHLGDVPDLRGQVARHRVHVVSEVLPRPGHPRHLRLPAELAVRAHLPRHPRHLPGEDAELRDHRVDNRGRPEEFSLQPPALHVQPHRLGEITLGDRRDGAGDLGRRPDQVLHEGVDRSLHLAPRLARAAESYALSSLALFPDGSAEPSKLVSDPLVAGYDVVECVGDLAAEARPLHGEPDGEVAIADLLERPEQRGKHERAINRAVLRCCHDAVAAICHCHTSAWGVERRSSQPRAWALSTSWTEFFARVLPRRILRKVSTVLGLI